MIKKLKIKFWKTEKALAMQILEQEGLPEYKNDNGAIRILSSPSLFYETGKIYLRGQDTKWDYAISSVHFKSNQDRDEYLDKLVNTITDELFAGKGELKVGEMCEVRDIEDEEWETRKLLAILPPHIEMPFVVERKNNNAWVEGWAYARPLTKRTEPKVETNGEIITYTWEEK